MKLYLFDRTYKIIHFDDLKVLENAAEIIDSARVTMSQNEVFVVQLAVLSDYDDVIKTITSAGNLKISCINIDVVDKYAKSKKQCVQIKAGIMQPLFFTVQAEKIGKREETASITIETEKETRTFELVFNINDSPVQNNGYNDLWRLSRLKWLNSDIEQNDDIVRPYTPPAIMDDRLVILGREIQLGKNGLPLQVCSKFDEAVELCDEVQQELFYKAPQFVINGSEISNGKTTKKLFNNRVECVTVAESENYESVVSSVLRYDGQMEYIVEINPKTDFTADNTALNFYVSKACSTLMHGLGHRASAAENLSFKWDNDKQQDCIYIGTVNCGMRIKYKAEDYIRPLINIFYKNLPLKVPTATWDNHGNGGISVSTQADFTEISAFTGKFEFRKGETRRFIFDLSLTPFKPIDYKKAFSVRYSHSNKLTGEYKEIDRAKKNGLNYVTFHQGNMIMPFINYPFYEVDRLQKAVQYAKDKGIGIKLYYTEREHSNHMAETFVYKALGDEIILRKGCQPFMAKGKAAMAC